MFIWGLSFFVSLVFSSLSFISSTFLKEEKMQSPTPFPYVDSQSSLAPSSNDFAAWLVGWETPRTLVRLKEYSSFFSSVSPALYQLSSSGTLVEEDYFLEKDTLMSYLNDHSFSVVPLIGNSFDSQRVHEFLLDSDLQNKFISSLITLAKTEHYAGWEFDWENISLDDKDQYLAFLHLC
jgi:spore germination protein YaaH